MWGLSPTLIIYYAANANAPVTAAAAPVNSVAMCQVPSSKHMKAIFPPVVNRNFQFETSSMNLFFAH